MMYEILKWMVEVVLEHDRMLIWLPSQFWKQETKHNVMAASSRTKSVVIGIWTCSDFF